jgi:hypothetical protein
LGTLQFAPLAVPPKPAVILEEPGQHVQRERSRVDLFTIDLAVHGGVPFQIGLQFSAGRLIVILAVSYFGNGPKRNFVAIASPVDENSR